MERPALVDDLRDRVDGDVQFDSYTRQLYATDASVYEVAPIGVVFPQSTDDVASTVTYCAEREISVLPRGGGTSLAGQAANEACLLDFTRYMDGAVSTEPNERRARIEAGAVLGEFNDALPPYNLKFAADSAAGNRITIGCAIGNNSTGAQSLVYVKTGSCIEECEIVLADATVNTLVAISVERLREQADSDGTFLERSYAEVVRTIDEEREAV